MNENTETNQKPAPTRFQRLKMRIMKPAMALSIAITAMMGSASATSNISFDGVVDVINAVIPIFDSLVDLIIAVVPLIIVMAVVGGIVLLIRRVLGSSLGGFKI
ncbi:MAG: hypothetical protein ACKVE3_08430 [Dissulfuribacterales bacterium]